LYIHKFQVTNINSNKVVINDNGGTKVISNFPLFVDQTQVVSGVTNTFSSDDYVVSETEDDNYSSVISGACDENGNVSLSYGDNKTCTITNDDVAPTLTFTKLVTNNYGGTLGATNFPLFINGNSVTSGTPNTLLANFLYTLTETQQPGYTGGYFTGDCSADGSIVLSVGDNKTCYITNTDVQPQLTVTKVVINDDGGTNVISDFSLFVSSTGVKSGVQNGFNAGNYTIGETGISGYSSTISGDCATDGSITLAVGDVKTCTITNNDDPGTLIVKKVVSGGDKIASDFEFIVNDDDSQSFESDGQNDLTVDAGNYTITEVNDPEYSVTYDNCEDVNIVNGGSATCTITNTKPGTIQGFKYNDTDGDYLTTSDQTPVGDWGISLYQCMTSWTPENCAVLADSTTTGTDGSYSFTNLFGQMYRVVEELRSGWTPLFPTDGIMDVNLGPGATGNVNFVNQGNLSITACKYEDSNGTQNGGNFTPVNGWDFTLGQTTQNTDNSNCTTFDNLTPGTYNVSELSLPDGWQISDDSQGSQIVLTDSDRTVDFYNYRHGTISGSKWDVVNGNGDWEDESALPDWHIQLFENNDGDKGAQVGEDEVTNSDGNYTFENVTPGSYFVCEVNQIGWNQTYPDFDSDYPNCHEVTVTSGREHSDINFGNFKLGQVYGFKYEDTDGDGFWDEGEDPINDWEICLGNENWEGVECTYTYDSGDYGDGYFEFTGLEYGNYTLTEDESNLDYQRTQPEADSYNILIESGSGFGEGDAYYFGNAPLTDIYGYKWSDDDGDGERDDGEEPLGDWTIFLDENGDEQLDEGEEWTTTEDNNESDNFGRYSFFDLLPGNYSICEVQQDGWNQTYPFYDEEETETYCHNITLPNKNQNITLKLEEDPKLQLQNQQ
jgi:hypothetical protein